MSLMYGVIGAENDVCNWLRMYCVPMAVRVSVCMLWMAEYVQSYVFCPLTIQSFLHQQFSFSRPEHYVHSLSHATILVQTIFVLLRSFTFLSLPLFPMVLPLCCYSALSSIVSLIYLSLFFIPCTSLSLFPLISFSLFRIVLRSHRADLTYIHCCRRDPFQMKGFCCQDSRFPLSKYYWM